MIFECDNSVELIKCIICEKKICVFFFLFWKKQMSTKGIDFFNETLTLAQYTPLSHFDYESVLSMALIYFFAMAFDYMVFEEQDFVLHSIAQNHAVARTNS